MRKSKFKAKNHNLQVKTGIRLKDLVEKDRLKFDFTALIA